MNLECVISDKGLPWLATPREEHFRSDRENIHVLTAAGVSVVSVANDHALDFEYEGLETMLANLRGENIESVGAGTNIEEAMRPAVVERDGLKMGIIAATDHVPEWEAHEELPGIFYVPIDLEDPRAKALFEIVAEMKKKMDIVIVSLHWGPEHGYKPPGEQIPFAYRLIDSGADIVYGHGGGVFRGVEIYAGKPILYSTGNFVDDYTTSHPERNDQSFLFMVETEKTKLTKLHLYPTTIRNLCAEMAEGDDRENIFEQMEKLCAEFKTPTTRGASGGRLEIDLSTEES